MTARSVSISEDKPETLGFDEYVPGSFHQSYTTIAKLNFVAGIDDGPVTNGSRVG